MFNIYGPWDCDSDSMVTKFRYGTETLSNKSNFFLAFSNAVALFLTSVVLGFSKEALGVWCHSLLSLVSCWEFAEKQDENMLIYHHLLFNTNICSSLPCNLFSTKRNASTWHYTNHILSKIHLERVPRVQQKQRALISMETAIGNTDIWKNMLFLTRCIHIWLSGV